MDHHLRWSPEQLLEEIRKLDPAQVTMDEYLKFKTDIQAFSNKVLAAFWKKTAMYALLSKDISELGVSVRALNALRHGGITTLGETVQQTEQMLLITKNFGKKSLTEVVDALERKGLRLGMQFEEITGEKG